MVLQQDIVLTYCSTENKQESFMAGVVGAGLSLVGGKAIAKLAKGEKYSVSSISRFGKKLNQSKIGKKYATSKWGKRIARVNKKLNCRCGSASRAFLGNMFGWKFKFGFSYYASRC